MKREVSESRRRFLKTSAAGTAGLAVAGLGARPVRAAWTSETAINPSIPNTRVVCCHDSSMITGNWGTNFSAQNNAVSAERVGANLDEMAMALSSTDSADGAWGLIFQKPATKEWNEVLVAVKVNCIYTPMMPHIAIIGKICRVLIDLGVAPGNITVYDAKSNASGNDKYSPYVGNEIPDGVIVSDQTEDGPSVPVGGGSMQCCSVIAHEDGGTAGYHADILVNCAINKGHSQTDKGGFTLTMKNHVGTMRYSCPSLAEMIAMNMSEAIVGGNGGAPCRQQLCIVDSLWAASGGPFDPPDYGDPPARIAMGTFGPAVDIMVTRRIREDVMGASHNESAIADILEAFGYSENDLDWIEVPPASAVKPRPGGAHKIAGQSRDFSIRAVSGGELRIAVSYTGRFTLTIHDATGRIVRQADGAGPREIVLKAPLPSGACVARFRTTRGNVSVREFTIP